MDNLLIDHDILANAIEAAKALGLDVEIVEREPPTAEPHIGALLRLRFGGQEIQYAAEIKRGLRPATLGAVLHQLDRLGQPALLVTDYVTPPLADTLRERGVAFLDTAGNAYLHQPPLLVWVKGQRPTVTLAATGAQGRAFQAKGLQVLFALLCLPNLVDRPYREIARLAGVAHGTIGWVMTNLAEEGFLTDLGKAGRRLHNRRRLLDVWVEAYARTLRPKLLLGRFIAPEPDWWETLDAGHYGVLFGAEPAAARLTRYLRPGVTTLYTKQIPAHLIADHRLRKDPTGDVEVRKRFWTFEQAGEHPDLVPPVLIYADLLATGDARCMEAARRVYDDHMAGFIEQE